MGKWKNAVKTAKNLMKKAIDSQSDPYLALLAWRNTPSESVNFFSSTEDLRETYENPNTYIRTAAETTATRRRRAEVTEEQSQTELLL